VGAVAAHLTQAQLLVIRVFLGGLVEVVHLSTQVLPQAHQALEHQVKETPVMCLLGQMVNLILVAVEAVLELLV
jgi:hypothetical protein